MFILYCLTERRSVGVQASALILGPVFDKVKVNI
jgi:hypothetical protein